MTPIHELLARARWDPEFGAAQFVIGYYDRVMRAQVRVPLGHIRFEPGAAFTFEAVAEDGSVHSVPYHRVRSVWRNGELIWQRHAPPAGATADRHPPHSIPDNAGNRPAQGFRHAPQLQPRTRQ